MADQCGGPSANGEAPPKRIEAIDEDDPMAFVDGDSVDVVWIYDHGQGNTPIVSKSKHTRFEPGWLHFQELDGTARSVPVQQIRNVRRSVTEEYLEMVR
ncbi:hypothetical protein [Halococcus saccharolyticus]|uniref:Uncharacterized protein n=1 Tax=Halococcus saccharolyticus DSM 5350 TaxID=1227455 RepID=M0MA71_9EURY|nr:hypothetical protein [Halococcus saccharolyticus]EMA42641.1 hypothetical protein C449_15903 [Halococcus saccharolyticus DSM 5350]